MNTRGSNLAWESHNEKWGKSLAPSKHNLGMVSIRLVAHYRLNPRQHVLQLFLLGGLWHAMAQKEIGTGSLPYRDLDILHFFPLLLLVFSKDSKIVNGRVMCHQWSVYTVHWAPCK